MIDKIKKYWNEISLVALVATTVVVVGVSIVEITKYYEDPMPESILNMSLNNTVVLTGTAFDCFGCLPIAPLVSGFALVIIVVWWYLED